ncbi:hypothetical protein OEZ85_001507 [Tetradesmus obliquus]|uniref:Non-specific serine/threonine protein kinase n=1 Tax=Tetradesmus obliquus TaxID=3088 RepID=A0ABY8UPY1_TETOB|nr:hypothetical protein OEZ85_001507 [Tetradesmus obliquus]
MKVLNPEAPAYVPGCAAAGKAGSVISDISAASAALAVKPAIAKLLISTTSDGAVDAALSTPNGLAELATCLSDNLTFEDMFDHGSRRGSLASPLDEQQQDGHDSSDDADDEFHDANPAPPEDSSDNASSCSADNASSRSCPMPIGHARKGSGGSDREAAAAAAAAEQQKEDAAAVAKAQRDLLADAAYVQMQSAAVTDASQPKLGPQDFEILRVVGQGAFGKVFQVRARASGKVFAMKVMRKERILQKDHGDYVRAERDLLTAVVHPYIVTLRYSFQSASKLYLVLDFINGGHLFFNLYRQGVFDEDVARLYTAEIVAALAYLHGRGIVHRDLKPENVLLDSDGHVRLTDFGLAKGDMAEGSRTNSFIGTMEYMAPEIIDGSGHGRAVDWWSTGILLYEMLAGQPPFRAKSRSALQQQITGAKPKFPKFLSSNALSLLKGLLTRDPAQRLGGGPDGAAAIKRHPFFRGLSWSALEARQLESKFKPGVKCSLSVENFDKIWTEQRPVDSPCGTPTDPAYAGAFEGFTYVAPSFMASSIEAWGAAKAAQQQQQQQ